MTSSTVNSLRDVYEWNGLGQHGNIELPVDVQIRRPSRGVYWEVQIRILEVCLVGRVTV